MLRHAILIAAVATPMAVFLPGMAATHRPAAAESFTIDGVHSAVIFRIKHLNASYSYGRFNDFSGSFKWDEANPEAATFDIRIKADSIDTHDAKRDAHLKGSDFFSVKQFPDITFKSKTVKKAGPHHIDVTGDLTLHGVTKPLTIKVEHVGSVNHPMAGIRTGFDAAFAIKRSDFGMNYMPDAIGDEVRLMVGIEGMKDK